MDKGHSYYVYIGSYTRKEADGVYVCSFESGSGQLRRLGSVPDLANPTFLRADSSKRVLYAIGTREDSNGQARGAVASYTIDSKTGQLAFKNMISSEGGSLCHISLDSESRFIMGASYHAGTAFLASLQPDGALGKVTDQVLHRGSGPVPKRQEGPHAHSIIMDRQNKFAFICDLGIDKIVIYRLEGEKEEGRLILHGEVKLHPGAGPRHFVFHPQSDYAYVINELDSTITAFVYDPRQGSLETLQTISTLPNGFDGENTGADIHLSPCGRFLYGSNRGHDSIAVFAVDGQSGRLTFVEHMSTFGQTPRNFALSPDGGYLIAANQTSGNLVVYTIHPETGRLQPTGEQLQLSEPVCVEFLLG